MDIQTAKNLLKQYRYGHSRFIKETETAEKYYRNETDIKRTGVVARREQETPLRRADNRIPSNFHGLLVNQEASYLFTEPPTFDIGTNGQDPADIALKSLLGDQFAKVCKDLCVDASNAGVGWLHVWVDKDNGVQYARINPKQIIPVWTDDLKQQLKTVIRSYSELDDDGKSWDIVEIWTDQECAAYKRNGRGFYSLEPNYTFTPPNGAPDNIYKHNFGFVPFVPFFKNNLAQNTLKDIKGLIDAYDKVFSGFLNDLEDIQEVIMVLSGYGGTDLNDILEEIKKYKIVDLQNEGEGAANSGLSALTIDIPVEAREKMLTLTRKAIFEQGMGIDPDPANFGNSSGVALSYLYSLLELKAGLTETEFRLGFGTFVRYLCQLAGIPCKDIRQTWTRTSVRNDTELAAIAQQSVGIISQQTIVAHHPWVEDPDDEMRRLEEEQPDADPYDGAFPDGHDHDHGGGLDGQGEQ